MFATTIMTEHTSGSTRRRRPADPAQLVLVACGYSRDSVACITVTIGLSEFPGHHRNVVSAAVLVDECAGIADTRNNRGSLKDVHSKILRPQFGDPFHLHWGPLSARM